MDLATQYLGLSLPHPFVAGASPLADSLDRARRLEDAGIAAIVLRSLFAEQIDQEAFAHHAATAGTEFAHGEAASYLPAVAHCVFGPDEYLEHLRRVKAAVDVPVIASLNGHTEGAWIEHARQLAAAGADAIELNLHSVATDPCESGAAIEARAVAVVRAVRSAVGVPVAAKLSPFWTALPHLAAQLEAAGADGLVLFNRFYEPDLDVEALEVRTTTELSDGRELLLRLRWLALLSGRVRGSLAVSGGVHTAIDAIKAVMCGAHAVQLVAALLRGGPAVVTALCAEMARWLTEHEYRSLGQMRGSMDRSRSPDPRAFERGNYVRALQTWRAI